MIILTLTKFEIGIIQHLSCEYVAGFFEHITLQCFRFTRSKDFARPDVMSVALLNVKLQLFERLLDLQPWLSFASPR